MSSGHVDRSKPLRPLTEHAWDALADACAGPIASHHHNAGVWDRLFREGLIDQRATRGGSRIYVATEAGHAKLRDRA
jgi:hypothetical protein